MTIELIHTIIHGFTKNVNSPIGEIKKKDQLLANHAPAVVALVTGVVGLIGKNGNAVSHGQFNDDGRQGKFPPEFQSYASNPINGDSFIKLSHIAVDELAEQAGKEQLATGGNILVSYYKNNGLAYLVVAIIKHKDGVSLDENFVPIEITEIDLSKVHQAVRINFTEFNKSLENTESDEDEVDAIDRNYLCFVGSRNNSELSAYFVTALGCTKGVKSSRATSNAIDAVTSFFSKNDLKRYRTRARDAVISYLLRMLSDKREATLEEICNTAIAEVLAEEREKAAGLQEFLNDDKNKVPSQFPVHLATLKKRTTIKSESTEWSIQFEQRILGVESTSTICYDKANRRLIIKDLNDKLVKSIESVLEARQDFIES